MTNAKLALPFPWATMIIVALMGSVYAVFGPVPGELVFSQQAAMEGSFWQLITGHLVHSDTNHLIWNGAAALILGGLLERHIGLQLIPLTLAGMLAVDVFLLHTTTINYYCGFSGVLNTWLAVLIAIDARNPKARPFMVFTAIAVLTKIAIEWHTNTALFTSTAWPSVPAAHMSGWIGGLVIMLAANTVRKAVELKNVMRPWLIQRPDTFFSHHIS